MNPLFDTNNKQDTPKDPGYILGRQPSKQLAPLSSNSPTAHAADEPANPAVEMIRRKLDTLYADEPDAKQEIAEAVAEPEPTRSRHQQYMYELSTSGSSLAEIQTAWHTYYAGLSDAEKHEVWQEFYDHSNKQATPYHRAAKAHAAAKTIQQTPPKKEHDLPAVAASASSKLQLHPASEETDTKPKVVVVEHEAPVPLKSVPKRRARVHKIKKQVLEKVQLSAAAQQKAKHHFQSLLFGIVTGVVVILVFLFGFFNERIIAPFIQPSRNVSTTPIILSNDSVSASETPEVIIPKINVQIPVIYDEKSVDEDAVQRALERGVIHYASTSLPGEQGNAAIFGHSSNNIFNSGKYKFAFVKLNELVPGDTFYLTRDKKVYVYRVYDKRVVEPTQTEVLNPVPGKTATATLITCDPPGTSKYRLVVWGEQVSPDPSGTTVAAAPSDPTPPASPAQLPSEGPTLWHRFTNWLF